MEKANLGLDDKQMKLLMAEADSDSNGAIDYFEFVPLAVDLITSLQAKMEVKAEEEDNEDRARLAANALHTSLLVWKRLLPSLRYG